MLTEAAVLVIRAGLTRAWSLECRRMQSTCRPLPEATEVVRPRLRCRVWCRDTNFFVSIPLLRSFFPFGPISLYSRGERDQKSPLSKLEKRVAINQSLVKPIAD